MHYVCVDGKRSDLLIDFIVSTFAITLPVRLLKFLSKLLNLIHFDGIMILSGIPTSNIPTVTLFDIKNAISVAVPHYDLNAMTDSFVCVWWLIKNNKV